MNKFNKQKMASPIRCDVASLVCRGTKGRMLKSCKEPSLWLLHVMANCPKRSLRSFLARKLNERKSATNSTKFNWVSHIIEVVFALTCHDASEPPGVPFLSLSRATQNKLRNIHNFNNSFPFHAKTCLGGPNRKIFNTFFRILRLTHQSYS